MSFFPQSGAHGGQPCPPIVAYALAHKGKATSDVTFNPEDPPESYSNASIPSRISNYCERAKEVHGLDFN